MRGRALTGYVICESKRANDNALKNALMVRDGIALRDLDWRDAVAKDAKGNVRGSVSGAYNLYVRRYIE